MRTWPVLLGWLVTRGAVLVLLCTDESGVLGDVRYYHESVAGLGDDGMAGTLVEYPVPAVALLWVPYLLLYLVDAAGLYVGLVPALAALTDLAFLAFLVRSRRWHRPRHAYAGIPAAEWAWLLGVPALGATAYARFDLIPGILVGLAMLYLVHRPAVAAAFGALATGVKYWPAIVLPTIAAPRIGRVRVLVSIAGVGVALALVSLALGGWDRLFSPFDYQGARGLQVESIAATPAMLAWGNGAEGYATHYATYKAYEVTGPMVGALLQLTTLATVAVALTLAALWLLAWLRIREGERGVDALVWLGVASVGGFVVTSKVFSPQYVLWLIPAAAAGLVVIRSEAAWRRLAGWTAALLVATALTHLVFPRSYGAVITYDDDSAWVVLVLAVRNLIVLGLFAWATVESGRLLLRRRSAEDQPVREPALSRPRARG